MARHKVQPAEGVVCGRIADVIDRIGHDEPTEGKYVIRGQNLDGIEVDEFATVFAEVSRMTGVPVDRIAKMAVWTNLRPVGQRGDVMWSRTNRRRSARG